MAQPNDYIAYGTNPFFLIFFYENILFMEIFVYISGFIFSLLELWNRFWTEMIHILHFFRLWHAITTSYGIFFIMRLYSYDWYVRCTRIAKVKIHCIMFILCIQFFFLSLVQKRIREIQFSTEKKKQQKQWYLYNFTITFFGYKKVKLLLHIHYIEDRLIEDFSDYNRTKYMPG